MRLGVARFTASIWLAVGLACAGRTKAPSSSPALPGSAALPVRPASVVSGPALGSVASGAPSVTASSSGRLLARPKLRVGTSGDYAPFSVRDEQGAVRGFDAEIARLLADDLGLELVWVSFRWPTLQSQLENSEFDVAMSGVTWQPTRAVLGYLTRSVARGGPCVLGDERATRIAVNRGGWLEAWARTHFAGRELVTVESNQALPEWLASGRVAAIVTDSFERRAFERPGWGVRCEPRLARKVYWVAPNHAELAAGIDAWLSAHSSRIASAQQRWFGESQRLDALAHLSDLLARRLAFMPLVAGAKAKLGMPIEDLPREKIVLDSASASARKLGLPEAETRAFFELQIQLSKAVQRRLSEASPLDLAQQIRPALSELGDRILTAVVDARHAGQLLQCSLADLDLLSPWLKPAELEQLRDSLRALGR